MRIVQIVCCAITWLLVAGNWDSPALLAESNEATVLRVPDLPDEHLVTAYRHAASDNVLAAVNPEVFPGYFSVCADGQGFGYGFTYPSLDGHQMTEALLWLGEVETVKLNWDHVRSFQKPDGHLPLAILPPLAGQPIGPAGTQATVDANGGLYEHWVPGNPLAALASPTYIQNADVIYRHTLDREWLAAQIDSVNLAADFLATLTTPEGIVRGAGYYVERPTRIASDGVSQCHAFDAFRRVAALNRVRGKEETALRYDKLANRIRSHFIREFWTDSHFAEYWHPKRGFIASHGLTDVDWASLATGTALPEQAEKLWPQLRREMAFYYGGMPTGISTRPETYEDWEFSHPDRHDLAAMGRVWYLEAWARSRNRDAKGLIDSLLRVAKVGRENGYSGANGYYPSEMGSPVPAGAENYCEYPANFLRVVNRFLLGIDLRFDGTVVVAPVVTSAYWESGFGHSLALRGGTLAFRLQRDRIDVSYSGEHLQRIGVRCPSRTNGAPWRIVSAESCPMKVEGDTVWLSLPCRSEENGLRVDVER